VDEVIPENVPALLYDCTHDNETHTTLKTTIEALSTLALVCMSNCAIATTFGFDILVPTNPSVVSEFRTYKFER
jgi:glycogen debranching enzyme